MGRTWRALSGWWRNLPRARAIGRAGERAAARRLRREGLEIIGRNVRVGRDEIDLIARDGDVLVFVEVKSRTVGGDDGRTGLERLDRRKRRALRRGARTLLARWSWTPEACRMDAVVVEFRASTFRPTVVEITWYPGILQLWT